MQFFMFYWEKTCSSTRDEVKSRFDEIWIIPYTEPTIEVQIKFTSEENECLLTRASWIPAHAVSLTRMTILVYSVCSAVNFFFPEFETRQHALKAKVANSPNSKSWYSFSSRLHRLVWSYQWLSELVLGSLSWYMRTGRNETRSRQVEKTYILREPRLPK